MLRWIGRKYMEMQEVREENRKNGEMGFTLIELLVVVIIIGILAAIAIPTFLNQRNNAYNATAKSSVRNAATNAESFATNNNGSYATLTETAIDDGISQTNVDTKLISKSAGDYCISGKNKDGGDTWYYKKTTDTISATACT